MTLSHKATLLSKTIPLLLLALIACGPLTESRSPETPYLTIPFDTASVIASMNIVESLNRLDLIDKEWKHKSSKLGKLDTLDLMYISYACDCPNWVIPSEYEYAESLNKGTLYSLYEGFYLEPAHQSVAYCDNSKIIGNLHLTGNIIRFIGKKYLEDGYPQNAHFIDPDPPKGKVFRYYAFEIQRPFVVWGPPVLIEDGLEAGETYASKLTVKEEIE